MTLDTLIATLEGIRRNVGGKAPVKVCDGGESLWDFSLYADDTNTVMIDTTWVDDTPTPEEAAEILKGTGTAPADDSDLPL